MDYSIIICPKSGKKLSINTIEGINTIINYTKYSNIKEKHSELQFLEHILNKISLKSTSLSNSSSNFSGNLSNTSSYINNTSSYTNDKKQIKKGRFIIIKDNISYDNSEIITDSDKYSNYSYSSSELSNYSSDISFETDNNLNDALKTIEENSILTKDEIKWGRAPKGYLRKGRFLIKK